MTFYHQTAILLITLTLTLSGCDRNPTTQQPADMVIRGGPIYTVNANFESAEAVAVKRDKILFVGKKQDAEQFIGPETRIIELNGRSLMPGFIESHVHIFGLGHARMNVDLNGATSYAEVIARVKQAADKTPAGQWILGRGWHQSKWQPQPQPQVKGFQTHHALSQAVPDHPVFLTHASGHAGFANAKAMQLADITAHTPSPEGGEIIKDDNGELTGVFNELAQALISTHIDNQNKDYQEKALRMAMQETLQNGITSVHNAGTDPESLSILQDFAQRGELAVRVYVMLDGKNAKQLEEWFARGPLNNAYNNFLSVRGIKLYADGALGSRGAWLLEAYHDRDAHFGMPVNDMNFIQQVAEQSLQHGFQLAVHAIGDRGNREVLDRFATAFKNHPQAAKDHRFRIEHAQHIDPVDIPRFGELGVIASMQAIHLSSDRPWAIERLGIQRIEASAYAWQKLLQSGAVIINGTDAPVEPISPIASFYASVTRKRLGGEPEGGYEAQHKMTRAQALRSYTASAAYGEFAENLKGSIEPGKLADFTIFSQDIMTAPEDKLLDTQVDFTIVNGEIAYQRAN